MGREGNHQLVRVAPGQPGHEVDLGAHGPLAARGRIRHGAGDALRGAVGVGRLDEIEGALRMDDDPDARLLLPPVFDVLDVEHLMDHAEAIPKIDLGPAHGLGGVSAQVLVPVPDEHA